MKFLQKTWVAWLLTAVMIAAAIGIGQTKGGGQEPEPLPSGSTALDESLSTAGYDKWIWDDAGLLSASTEKQISLYNANWDYRYNSVVAIVTTDSTSDLEEFAWDQGIDLGLGEGDAILAISARDEDWFVAPGDDFSTILTNRVVSDLEDILSGKLNDKTVLAFYEALNQVYLDNFGLGNAGSGSTYAPGHSGGGNTAAGVMLLAVILIAIVLVVSAIDRMRYNTYRRQYYGVVTGINRPRPRPGLPEVPAAALAAAPASEGAAPAASAVPATGVPGGAAPLAGGPPGVDAPGALGAPSAEDLPLGAAGAAVPLAVPGAAALGADAPAALGADALGALAAAPVGAVLAAGADRSAGPELSEKGETGRKAQSH